MDRNITPDKLSIIMQDDQEIIHTLTLTLSKLFEPSRGTFHQVIPPRTPDYISKPLKTTPMKRKLVDYKEIIGSNQSKFIKVDLESIKEAWSLQPLADKPKSFTLSTEQKLEIALQIEKHHFKQMKIIGQFNLGFILASWNDYLFIIDQHASDEKAMYEKLASSKVNTQSLISYNSALLGHQSWF